MRALLAGRHRHQISRALEHVDRLIQIAGRVQLEPERHQDRVAPGILGGQLIERGYPLAGRRLCPATLRQLQRPPERPEPLLDGFIEGDLHAVQVATDRPIQRFFGVDALSERAKHRVQRLHAVAGHQVLHQQRGLVVSERDGVRVGEPGIQVLQLQDLIFVERVGERELLVATPIQGVRALPRRPKCLQSASVAPVDSTSGV